LGRTASEAYYERVRQRAYGLGVSIDLLTNVEDSRLQALLSTSKFYIGSKKYEHFGLSVLEAAQAGCLTFVHDTGGQREIITPEILRYTNADELVDNVSTLISNEMLRFETFQELKKGLAKLSLRDFYDRLERVLRPLLDEGL